MRKLIVIVSLLIGAVLVALNIHIVQLDDSYEVLVKTEMTFEDTYVDARGAKKFELLTKPKLIEAGIKELINDLEQG